MHLRFISADRVFDGEKFLPSGTIVVLDELLQLADLLPPGAIEAGRVQRLEGWLTPGFVNAHCHLELSHLKGRIARHTGLPAFGKQVIVQRDQASAAEKEAAMAAADREMYSNGIVAVGDISNGAESFSVKAGSRLFYHTFVELIGLRPEHADPVFQNGLMLLERAAAFGLRASLAPHAPYSTSTRLMARIAAYNHLHGWPFSLHSQESDEERKFLMGEPSGFHELYAFLGLDVSWFVPPGAWGLQLYGGLLAQGPSLLVHNTLSTSSDLAAVAGKDVYWCFCPGANRYIENQLPDLSVFTAKKSQLCVGTDSLASNDQLNLVAELNGLPLAANGLSDEEALQTLTSIPARALCIADTFGRLAKGKPAGINLVQRTNGAFQFITKIA